MVDGWHLQGDPVIDVRVYYDQPFKSESVALIGGPRHLVPNYKFRMTCSKGTWRSFRAKIKL
jgi:hypothetical protein